MTKAIRAHDTLRFKQEAVRLIKNGGGFGGKGTIEESCSLLKDYGIAAALIAAAETAGTRSPPSRHNASRETSFGSLKVGRLHSQRCVIRRHTKHEALA